MQALPRLAMESPKLWSILCFFGTHCESCRVVEATFGRTSQAIWTIKIYKIDILYESRLLFGEVNSSPGSTPVC